MPSAEERMAMARARRAAEYTALPANQRAQPKVERCPVCGEDVYQQDTCPGTGFYHPRSSIKIVNLMRLAPGQNALEGNQMTEMVEKKRIRQQKQANVPLVEVDRDALSFFQSYIHSQNWSRLRWGICYGTVDYVPEPEPGEQPAQQPPSSAADAPPPPPPPGSVAKVYVHAIYEPVAQGGMGPGTEAELQEQLLNPTLLLKQDRLLPTVDKIADNLGLGRVGLIVARRGERHGGTMSPVELLASARQQALFGPHCVLIDVTPESVEAFQASSQCAELYRFDIFNLMKKDANSSSSSSSSFSSSGSSSTSSSASNSSIGSTTNFAKTAAGKWVVVPPATPPTPTAASSSSSDSAKPKSDDPSPPPPPSPDEHVTSSEELEVVHSANSRTTSKIISVAWLMCYVAIGAFESKVRNRFMRIRDASTTDPKLENLRTALSDPRYVALPFSQRIRDFHVLIFIFNSILNPATELEPFFKALKKKDAVTTSMYERRIFG